MAEQYVERNRETWTRLAVDFAVSGERNWAQAEPTWGIFDVPESEVGMFPDDVAGMDAIELGCGTAYVSAWLAKRGAKPDRDRHHPGPARNRPPAPGAARHPFPAPSRATPRRRPSPTTRPIW